MYEKIIRDFKKDLTERKLERILIISLSIFLVFYAIVLIRLSLMSIQFWLLILLSVITPFISLPMIYTIFFFKLRKLLNLRWSDFFCLRRFFRAFKEMPAFKNDVEVMSQIVVKYNLNTQTKILVAIRHYQSELSRKPINQKFAILPIVSFVVMIFGIMISDYSIQSEQDMRIFITMLALLIVYTVIFCFLARLIYCSFYYGISDEALYKRIESALSEILMQKYTDENKLQQNEAEIFDIDYYI